MLNNKNGGTILEDENKETVERLFKFIAKLPVGNSVQMISNI